MKYTIKSRIWLESEQGVFLGQGRITLLKAIDKEGSLSKAAKSLHMSYKKAWNLVDAMNKTANQPLVKTSTGGNGGGGASVTTFGHKMITSFDKINENCWGFLDQQIKEHSF